MKNRLLFMVVVSVLLFASACSTNPTLTNAMRKLNNEAVRSDSFLRYRITESGNGIESYDISTPAATAANAVLKEDVMKAISSSEVEGSDGSPPKLLESRYFKAVPNGVQEVWVVKQGGKELRYLVEMVSSPNGGTDIRVEGPVQLATIMMAQ